MNEIENENNEVKGNEIFSFNLWLFINFLYSEYIISYYKYLSILLDNNTYTT